MSDHELKGLANIVTSSIEDMKRDPTLLRLAVAGCMLEDDPDQALKDLAAAVSRCLA